MSKVGKALETADQEGVNEAGRTGDAEAKGDFWVALERAISGYLSARPGHAELV